MNEQLCVRIDKDLILALKRAALEQGRKVNHLTSDALKEYIQRQAVPDTLQALFAPESTPANLDVATDILKLVEVVSNHEYEIKKIKNQISRLKPIIGPEKYEIPKGEFTKAEMVALDIICKTGAKGVRASKFQETMAARGISVYHSKLSTTALRERGLIRRVRWLWIFNETGEIAEQ